MPDNRNRGIANRLLETVHGGAMLFARKEQDNLRAFVKDYAENGPGWPMPHEDYARHREVLRDMMKERVVEQTDVALTYASTSFEPYRPRFH